MDRGSIPRTSPGVRREIVDLLGGALDKGHAQAAEAEAAGQTEKAWQLRKAADWISDVRKEVKEA